MAANDFVKSARAHFERGEFHDAAAVCRRGLLALPGDIEARLLLGRALMALQRYGEVLGEMRVVLEREPGNPEGLAIRGEALLYKGDVSKAAQVLRDAQSAAPHDPAVRALRERAEGALQSGGRALLFDEDPGATVTRHYPLNPGRMGQAMGPGDDPMGGMDAGGGSLIDELLDSAGRRRGPLGGPSSGPDTSARTLQIVNRGSAPGRAGGPAPAGKAGAAPAPGHGGSFEEPTAIYRSSDAITRRSSDAIDRGPGSRSPVSSFSSMSPEELAEAVLRGEQLDAGGHTAEETFVASDLLGGRRGGSAAPSPGSSGDSAGDDHASMVDEFDEDLAPTSMIGMDEAWRNIGSVPAARISTQALTDEAPPPIPPEPPRDVAAPAPMLPPPLAVSPPPPPGASRQPADMPGTFGQGYAAVPPRPPGRPPDPLRAAAAATSPEMPAARAVAAAQHASMPGAAQRAPQAPTSPEMPVARAAAVAARSLPPAPAPPPRPGPPPRHAGSHAAMSTPPFPSPAARGAGAASVYDPTVAVPRQSRGRARTWQYVLVAAVVIAGGALAGFQIRALRLDWEIQAAERQAVELMAQDTYAGYARARAIYTAIAAAQPSPRNQAALARSRAALAAELGEGYSEAQAAVGELSGAATIDAVVARAYMALAERDAGGALEHAGALAELAPEHPFVSYFTGRARLLAGAHDEALAACQQAVEREPRPLFLIWLGRAHLALDQREQAAAAFDRALERVPGHPAALVARARLAVAAAGTQAPDQAAEQAPGDLEPALEALLEQGARPLAEQRLGVSPGQMAQAALQLVTLRLRRGDEAGAREAIGELRSMGGAADPGIAVAVARALDRLGEAEAARAELARAVEAWPTRLDVRMALAELALRAGDTQAARAALADAEGMDEIIAGNAGALALRGRILLAANTLDRAISDLDAALALRPDLSEAVVARAEIDLRQGEAARAAERLAPLAEEDGPPEMRVLYAAALRRSGELDQARDVLDALLGGEAPPARGYLERARLARDQGRWAEARRAYASAAKQVPGPEALPEAAIETAGLALDTGDREGAREAIATLAARMKRDGAVLVEAARIHTIDGKHDQAEAYLAQAGSVAAPPRVGLARERGRLALRQGDLAAAVESLERVRGLDASDDEAMLLLVEARLAQRDVEAAREIYQSLASRPGADAVVRHLAAGLIAAAEGNEGKLEAALASYERARALEAKRGAAPRLIARVDYFTSRTLFEYDRLYDARKAAKRAIDADPGGADAYFVLGLAEYGRGELDDSAEAFEKALQRDAASLADAWFYLGEVEMERARAAEAKRAFRAYLERKPDGPRARDAKSYLRGLD